ncbi:MAG: hypothetical protein A2Z97_15040 [Bdellovibrionales bacterium GWB1_52_6]|nr:MAG: hypothetical protein A2Z97_15040 [Bdellovibrionales bacterium GWB1_52_6]OFZ03417.1 MAG: hypothetical protein A2X97_05580 [Bdellovibrionales bacterium GWA1_52_35]HCM40999.1 hypothetical protein [Bdellovibrionales bacterium]
MNPLEGKTILVVDDEPLIRELICEALSARGSKSLAAANGTEGFELFLKSSPEVIISDVRMSGGDGTELLRKVRERTSESVFSLISGFADVTTESLYDMGADAIFPKPFSMRKVISTIANLLLPQAERWSAVEQMEPQTLAFQKTAIDWRCVGRGGIFVPGIVEATVDEVVRLELHLSDPSIRLSGTGVVRWVRPRADILPKGMGVEILTLEEPGRSELIRKIQENQPLAFIPQGGKPE